MPSAPVVSRVIRLVVAGTLALGPVTLRAQANCAVPNGAGNCVIADNATQSINLTITRAVRLALSASNVALDAPVPADYDAGFGQSTGPVITAKANTGWNIAIRGTQANWTASPAPARANKPIAELQWGVNPAGPFTSMTTSNVTIGAGAATAGTLVPLYFRVTYSWLLDTPGSYSMPLQLTLTAP